MYLRCHCCRRSLPRLPEGKIASLIDLPAAFRSQARAPQPGRSCPPYRHIMALYWTQVSLIEWPERLGEQLGYCT